MALMGEEVAAGEVADEGLVDRGFVENEVLHLFGETELGDGDLVLSGAHRLLGDLGGERIAQEVLGLVLAFGGGGDDLCP